MSPALDARTSLGDGQECPSDFPIDSERADVSPPCQGDVFAPSRLSWHAGWHRLARFGAYRCALAQEVLFDKPLGIRTSFGCAAPRNWKTFLL